MAVLNVALTGGIAEGKTTVLRMFSELGLSTVSADEVARGVLEDAEVQGRVRERLGLSGAMDRGKILEAIAADPAKRRSLNEIMHPEVLARLVLEQADVVEVPLLVETCLHTAFRRVWVVTCGAEEQLRRLIERTGDEGTALRLLSTQLPTAVKRAFADRTIRTDRPPRDVYKDAEELARSLVSGK